MKILQIHDYPPIEGGGVEINVSRVSEELVQLGHEVTIATSRFSSETYIEKGRNYKSHTMYNGVKIIFLNSMFLMRGLIDAADVVHIHFTFSCRPASMLALEYAVKQHKKCIFSIRTNIGHIPFSALAKMSSLEKDGKLTALTELLSEENVTISAPSESTKESIAKLGITKEVFVVRNGLSIDPQDPITEDSDEIQAVDITYVGEISILKGINYLVDAVKDLKVSIPDIKVRLIGSGSDLELIKQLVEFFDLSENFLFSGYVPNKQISQYLKHTRVLVHPSLTETWCNAVAEALAYGVPVVTTSVEGLLELTNHGDFANLVKPANAASLCQAIQKLLTDEIAYQEVKQKADEGSKYVIKNYTLENQVNQLLNLYN